MDTLRSVEAMMMVLPEEDGPNSFVRSTLIVRMFPSTAIWTFFIRVSPGVSQGSVDRAGEVADYFISVSAQNRMSTVWNGLIEPPSPSGPARRLTRRGTAMGPPLLPLASSLVQRLDLRRKS